MSGSVAAFSQSMLSCGMQFVISAGNAGSRVAAQGWQSAADGLTRYVNGGRVGTPDRWGATVLSPLLSAR